jgi:hypothetical protein
MAALCGERLERARLAVRVLVFSRPPVVLFQFSLLLRFGVAGCDR